MRDTFIDYGLLRQFDFDGFKSKAPFPWENIEGFLTKEGFQALYTDYPSLELFEYHNNVRRGHGQRPHNRHFLAYESSAHHKGVVRHEQLPATWQRFIDEIGTSDEYRRFIRRALGASEFILRYEWHVGSQGSEVSPHLDLPRKLGTHLLYFNTSDDWNHEWGGATLALEGKKIEALNPDFSDFESVSASRITDNRSFLFKNTSLAWHGATALTSPPGSYRRLFNIVVEMPKRSAGRKLVDRARTLLGLAS
ncbi:2OG-Fe(II) oxygenase [Rhizobium calliandrae]|uniref:2OG-Fe(II) oxygenase n=1 Tax=Rhizobium calliandrae TaxID=1312182 RepID=A0ABT7KER7_9HYPH|nr:2OG-Fe(II) oxygenase [Rhizobium calliandrae]MDL2407116.1 2OG-Fe(II) oxygenase [Rhizobium calliandrae]